MMNFHSALAAVQKSQEFKKFREKNKKAILFSAFFILNPEFEAETQQVDYLMPDKKEITTFFVNPDGKVNSKQDELHLKKKEAKELKTEKIKDLDFIVEELKKNITCKPTKVITILQHHDSKQIWNITCILESFKILTLHFDCFSGKILLKEERNIFDFMKVEKGKDKKIKKK